MTARLLAGAFLSLAASLGACSSDNGGESANHYTPKPVAEGRPEITIAASNKEVAVGDTTTLMLNSRNTIGHTAEVEWTTTGGKLNAEENGQIVRVTFPEPGSYSVTARLILDNREVDRDTVTVNVRPLR